MEICSVHDIAYDGRYCPACQIQDDLQSSLDSADEEIKRQEKEIESLNDRVQGLEEIISNLKNGGASSGG